MQFTKEQLNEAINVATGAVASKWFPADCIPILALSNGNVSEVGIINEPTSYKVVLSKLSAVVEMAKAGKFATPELLINSMHDVVVENYARLVKKPSNFVEPEPDARLSIPHRDLFPQIVDVETGIKFVELQRKHGLQSSMDYKMKLNEVLRYVSKHELHAAKPVEVELTPQQQIRKENSEHFERIRAKVEVAKPGTGADGVGYTKRMAAFTDRTMGEFFANVRSGMSIIEAEKIVDQRIRAFEGTSIR